MMQPVESTTNGSSILNYVVGAEDQTPTPFNKDLKNLASKSQSSLLTTVVKSTFAGMGRLVDGALVGAIYGGYKLGLHDRTSPSSKGFWSNDKNVVCYAAGYNAGTAMQKIANTALSVKSFLPQGERELTWGEMFKETANYYAGPTELGLNEQRDTFAACHASGENYGAYRVVNFVLPIFNQCSNELMIGASAAMLFYSFAKVYQIHKEKTAAKVMLLEKIQEQFSLAADALKMEENHYRAATVLENMKRIKKEIRELGAPLDNNDISLAVRPLKEAAKEIVNK